MDSLLEIPARLLLKHSESIMGKSQRRTRSIEIAFWIPTCVLFDQLFLQIQKMKRLLFRRDAERRR